MNVFVIIVTYNGMHWISRCLEMLRRSTVPVTPVIVDNCSTDGTVDYIRQSFPEARLLLQHSNLGFGQANNVGIRYALSQQADYCLLLNQDAYLQPDALSLLLAESDGQSLLSPLHLNGTGEALDQMFRLSMKLSDNALLDDLLLHRPLSSHYESYEICAACWLLPRTLIEKVGGFNPLFFHYGEDNNYYHRMVYHGVKTLCVPAAHVWHDRGLFGNATAYNHRKLRRDLLLKVCDINAGYLRRLKGRLNVLLRCYTRDLRRGAYRPTGFLQESLWLLFHYRSIRRSRRLEKLQGPTWL